MFHLHIREAHDRELVLSEFSPIECLELVGVFLLHLKLLMSLW